MQQLEQFYTSMLLIRRFEELVQELFSQGQLFGTTHTCIGQEANAVGVISCLRKEDRVFSNHRCHGHFLARHGDIVGLLAELMGKENGVCRGIGGSQHLYKDGFFSNGIIGSYLPIVTGMALGDKLKQNDNIVVACMGDGALGQGVVYEAFNLMSLLSVRALVIIENNRYAQSTPIKANLAGTISGRIKAFGIEYIHIDTTDVIKIHAAASAAIKVIRNTGRPFALVIDTYRLCAHSKGDDTRDEAEIEAYRQHDPLLIAAAQLDAKFLKKCDEEVSMRLQEALQQCKEHKT